MSDQPRNQTRRLVRRTDRKVIGGVAVGLADFFGLDPLLFRIGFVVFAITGFGGVLAYLLAWAFIPAHDQPASAQRAAVARWAGIAVLVFAGLAIVPALLGLFSSAFWFHAFPPWHRPGPVGDGVGPIETLAVAGLLVAVGMLLLRRPAPRDDDVTQAAAAPSNAGPAQPAAPLPVVTESMAVERRPRSPLPAFTLASVFVAIGIAAGLGNLGILVLDVGQYAALALLLLGTGILVGAWWGRARILIWLGVLMLPFVAAASFIDVPLEGDVGSHYVQPHSVRDLYDREILFGDLTLDLTEFPFDEHPHQQIDVQFGAGEVNIIVPEDIWVEADVETRLGEVFVLGSYDDGLDAAIRASSDDPPGAGHLVINVDGGVGAVHINFAGFMPPSFSPPRLRGDKPPQAPDKRPRKVRRR